MSASKRKPEIYSDSDNSSTEDVDERPNVLDSIPPYESQDPLEPDVYIPSPSKDNPDGITTCLESAKEFISIFIQCVLLFNSLEELNDSIITFVTTSKKAPNTGVLDIMDHLNELMGETGIEKLPSFLWKSKIQISHILSTYGSNIKNIIAAFKSFYRKYSKDDKQTSSSCFTSKRQKTMENTYTSSTHAIDLTDSAAASSGESSVMNLGLPNIEQLHDMIHHKTEKISSSIYVSSKEGSAMYTYHDPNPKKYIVQLQIFPTKAIALEEKKNWWKHKVRQHLFHCDIDNNQDPRSRYIQKLIEQEHTYLQTLKKNGTPIEENIRSKLL